MRDDRDWHRDDPRLGHRYGKTHALHGVDLTVASGECVALLGPHGAGKTTLVSALTGRDGRYGPVGPPPMPAPS